MLFEDSTYGPYDKAENKARKAFELYEDGKISQALLELEDALQINPSNSAWHFNKALSLDSISRFEDAISEYEAALELNPMDLEILNSMAVDYTRTGHYDLAISTFEHIQGLDPEYEPSYCNRIITYTEMDQHDLAEQMFYLAQQINPDCALCYYNIGNSLFVRGMYKQAVDCWLRTAELEPTHPQINYRIAQAYWSQGRTDIAREHFLGEIRTNPGDVDVILDFGLFLLDIGDIDSAREKFNRILEFTPDSAPASFYLGEIAFNNKEYKKAVQLFDQALQKDRTLAGPRYRLAQYALINGRKEQAKAYLASEVELAPEDVEILISIGSMFLSIDESDLATHCLLKAIDIDSASADAYYYLGLASTNREEFGNAAEFLTHALDINSEHLPALKDLAAVYLATGRTDDAAEQIKKALALTKNDPELRKLSRRTQQAKAMDTAGSFLSRLKPHLSRHS